MRKLICGLGTAILLGTAGCSVVLPTYTAPEDGPRAKVRVVYGGGGAKFLPGQDCQPGRFKFGLDVMGIRIPAAGMQRKLGMPLEPDGAWYDEVYVRAGEPLTARYVWRGEAGYKKIGECATPWFTFVPEQDANYEMEFRLVRDPLTKIVIGCEQSLVRLVEDKPGEYRREPMETRPPARTACKKASAGGTGK